MMSQRRSLGTITKAIANGTLPKKPSLPSLPKRKKLPGVSQAYKYRYKQLPDTLRNDELLRMQNGPLSVPVMPRQPTLTVINHERRFPVRRVYCVGGNYRKHVEEMGNNPDKDRPFFFTKPCDATVDVSRGGSRIPYPQETSDLQHEVELVVTIGKTGRNVPVDLAMKYVFGVAVGVDLTRRDLQLAAKKAGGPWDCSKGFDFSAPVGAITPLMTAAFTAKDYKANEMEARREWKARGEIGEKREQGDFVPMEERDISLSVDGQVRQKGKLGEMVWSIAHMVSRLSELYTIEPGDILFTGTPAGVGPLKTGENVEAVVQGLQPCCFTVDEPLQPTPSPIRR